MDYDVNLKDLCSKFSQKWLYDNTLFLTVAGSHCYGLNTPTSDLDLRGICIAPKKYYIGLLDRFEQAITNEPTDLIIFEIKKFVNLSMNNNPNAIELLFTEDRFHLLRRPEIEPLFEIRDSFLSKKARWTYAGYAKSQLNRIKSHQRFLLHPIEKVPAREYFGLKDNYKDIPKNKLAEIRAEIRKVIDGWVFDSTGLDNDVAINIRNNIAEMLFKIKLNSDDFEMYAARSLGLDDNLLDIFRKESDYRRAKKDYDSYQNWKKNRNKTRYELEAKHGYDTKHSSHLIRLYLQGEKLLRTGKLKVFLDDDIDFIRSVRNGALTYDQIIELSDQKDRELADLYLTSTLKDEPERNKINKVTMEIIENLLFKGK